MTTADPSPSTTATGNKPKTGGGIAADATFLETLDQTSSSVLDLHKSNLLRLQADELVQETCLATPTKLPPSWFRQVPSYSESIGQVLSQVSLHQIDQATLDSCPFVLQSDQFANQRLLDSLQQHTTNDDLKLHVMPFHATPAVLSQQILGRGNCGLTNASGNAQELPTFDVVVQLPASLFATKDYLKHRYFDKRNLIVWHVAQSLSHKKHRATVGQVQWMYDHNDVRKPSLVLIPPTTTDSKHAKKKQKTSSSTKPKKPKFRLRLRFEMESIQWIPSLRLVPNRNNIHQQQQDKDDTSMIMGSPMYNHALLEDAYHSFLPSTAHTPHHHHKKMKHDSDDESDSDENDDDDDVDDDDDEHFPHWLESVVLAKIWCLQRGLLRCHDGFTTDHLALMILYLYRTKQANPRMGPLQVLAVLFKCLAETTWLDVPTPVGTANKSITTSHRESNSSTNPPRRKKRAVLVMPLLGRNEGQTMAASKLAKLYQKQTQESPLTDKDPTTLVELYRRQCTFCPIFLDSTMTFNYFGRLSPSFMRLVQQEATKSLMFLHSPTATAVSSPKLQQPSGNSPSSSPTGTSGIDKPFQALFMTSARFWDRFDLYLKISLSNGVHLSNPATPIVREIFSASQRADFGDYEAVARSMMIVLDQALGNRIKCMRFLSSGNGMVQEAGYASDQTPLYEVQKGRSTGVDFPTKISLLSPTGDDYMVLGISLNVDNCHRVVDRGPPPEQTLAVQEFLELWGPKAELRRFKDGAIVQAVVWNNTKQEKLITTRYQNEDAMQGGIVERITNYILQRHFLSDERATAKSAKKGPLLHVSPLRHMTGFLDGVAMEEAEQSDNAIASSPWFSNPTLAHRSIMKNFDELASFLKENSLPTIPVPGTSEEKTSLLGIPLAIDAVEPLSESLRYSDLFPPLPHPFLGNDAVKGTRKVSGVLMSKPIHIQIRFGASSKWPTDLKAMGAAKTAMLIQLANGIEAMMQSSSRSQCDGFVTNSITVSPTYLDVGFRGYMFRIQVRADPEIRFLQRLHQPSAEAAALLQSLIRDNIILAKHHSMVHAIHTQHASAGGVVRLVVRWVAGHLLSGLITQETVELLVAKVYTDANSPLDPPGTVAAGFIRFLQLLETHDWINEPLIVDPHAHLDDSDRGTIKAHFEQTRGPEKKGGPPLYIVTPYDGQKQEPGDGITDPNGNPNNFDTKLWEPSFASSSPEWVVLTRTIGLAKKTRAFLLSKLTSFNPDGWESAFQEVPTSFKAYSALLRVESDLATVDESCSSTAADIDGSDTLSAYSRSMRDRFTGPKALRLKLYRNMRDQGAQQEVLQDWTPVDHLVRSLRENFGSHALFFYNHLCPEVVGVLWRPNVLVSRSFSVMTSEYSQPCIRQYWKADTMVMVNCGDLLREMSQYYDGIVSKVKMFQAPTPEVVAPPPTTPSSSKEKRKAQQAKVSSSSSSSESEEDDG